MPWGRTHHIPFYGSFLHKPEYGEVRVHLLPFRICRRDRGIAAARIRAEIGAAAAPVGADGGWVRDEVRLQNKRGLDGTGSSLPGTGSPRAVRRVYAVQVKQAQFATPGGSRRRRGGAGRRVGAMSARRRMFGAAGWARVFRRAEPVRPSAVAHAPTRKALPSAADGATDQRSNLRGYAGHKQG